MVYERIDYETIERRYLDLIREMKEAGSEQECRAVLKKRQELFADMTPMELCTVRHDLDVRNAFYAAEQAYYDEIWPKIMDLSRQFERALLHSPCRDYIEQLLGHQALVMMETGQQGYQRELIPLVQEENNRMNQYNQLVSTATVFWKGTKVKRSLMAADTQSRDRGVRKAASLAVSDSWEAQRAEIEEIYDRLVKNQDEQARQLGFSNYVELSYYRMNRIGYDAKDVARFREQIKRHLVPLLVTMEDNRRVRIGLDELYLYDNGIFFPEGNPVPLYDTQGCLEAARKMYTQMSPETGEYIAFLLDHGLYDVEIRDGKRGGGYMAFFEKYRAPFIMANFDGTIENAYIMCHEGGHAFQGYLKRNEEFRERRDYSAEAAETHAMAMEFFAWPYMELFFGDRAEDYRTMHLEDALRLIVRECQQDEFQQLVYENPSMSKQERNLLWQKLELSYFPERKYDGDRNLMEGCGWMRIPHMFHWPFYAIDYALAQVCALEYLQWMKKDKAEAWQSYLTFCKNTGTENFRELVRHGGLGDPFEEGTIETLVSWIQTQLC